ncbi:hypothetical protein [Chryseobacterium lathyri]|uniref:Uncharacterized protein n=1 Tax=Chryseobacterium lathyri TaxID=395933 RepID=A0ABT9SRM7_9FLAO|nr:hypothetical protein [Chryseobacterium lathyri]MDP9961095.1 hypothetical protein [Chryseobacterium lathyri]
MAKNTTKVNFKGFKPALTKGLEEILKKNNIKIDLNIHRVTKCSETPGTNEN